MQESFLISYSHHKVICLCFWLLWKEKLAEHHIFNKKFKSHSKIMVETTCQPLLEDHSSRWLECKHCFLLATPVTKSFAFRFWLLWKDKFAEHHIFNQRCKSHSKIVVETTCQPVLEDHDSCRLECKRRFLLATLVTKSFTFVFDCSGKINLPSNRKFRARTSPTFLAFYFWSTEVTSQTHLQSFLLVTSVASG